MASTSYFGRAKHDGRSLGADFDLLAKWTKAFSLGHPIHSYYLTQLSNNDRAQLFTGPAQDFRLEEGPGTQIKLETLQDEVDRIDPEVVAMIQSSNYQRSEARQLELRNEIEDAQDKAEGAAALALSGALLGGMDGPPAEKLAKRVADKILDSAAAKVKARWKVARRERLMGSGSDTDESQATPKQQVAANKLMSPHLSVPDYGSETSSESAHWNSPRCSAGEEPVSPDLESVIGFDDVAGGVALLPSSLVDEMDCKHEFEAATPTRASYPVRSHTQTPGGHLGTGLSQALFVVPATANLMSTSHFFGNSGELTAPTVMGPFATRDNNPINTVGRNTTAEAPSSIFSPSSKTTKYPTAKEQPWMGFTCYEVATKFSNDRLVPKYWTTKRGKERFVRHKLGDLKLDDAKLRSDRFSGSVARNPVHIFIDLSNIIIGFYDSMKESRGISVNKRVVAPAFSFKNFDTILTRDRNVAKRIVAGSLANSYHKRWPDYMLQAQELKYEMNILERVPKPASPVRKRKPKVGPRDLDAPTSGADTSGEDRPVGPMKHGEQGVDELLHLKILQSAMDTARPATMVLATGDAASAQYSDGFKKNIERVLSHGWNIELYGWSRNISSAWREPEFTEQWGHQFKIVELDEFCEELFDMTIESLEQ
ncbi:hypothetical protein NEMBOFW57_010541 [Staphylotrichum longicolle]|uniref:NYN domain-containing protein n=1 Tax=Staphylotrichum longicolle TaxID=669026 RepID=A0AAD4HX34_9PEZI|nr:hypothetical protein NEMBOFW57_010541 [Staphylotrichum longicolle]